MSPADTPPVPEPRQNSAHVDRTVSRQPASTAPVSNTWEWEVNRPVQDSQNTHAWSAPVSPRGKTQIPGLEKLNLGSLGG